MRHLYSYLDPKLIQSLLAEMDLLRIFNHLLLASGGNVAAAMRWMQFLQEQGHLAAEIDLEAFFASLEERGLVAHNHHGELILTGAGERRIRQGAFEQLFSKMRRGGSGYHPLQVAGEGSERLSETRTYQFGDDLHRIDPVRSIQNALRRTHGELELSEEDLVVYETEHLTTCATVIAIDISHSMILYGEDRITPAKTVALALTELITTKYPKDSLEVIVFGDRAERVEISGLPYIEAGPFHTNTREGLQMARALLARHKQPNKQIFMITDGKPSALTIAGELYKNPFGLDLKIVNRTLEEADRCRRQNIVLTTFMLATDPTLTDFVEKMTRTNRGRAYFASPHNLGEFIFADYIRNRRSRIR